LRFFVCYNEMLSNAYGKTAVVIPSAARDLLFFKTHGPEVDSTCRFTNTFATIVTSATSAS
jgi:hypothetical protein